MAVPVQRERVGMSLQDFLATDECFDVIHGIVIRRPLETAGHAFALHEIFPALDHYAQSNARHEVFAKITYVVDDSSSTGWVTNTRTPDVAVFDKAKYDAWISTYADYKQRFISVVPDIVAEVISVYDNEMDTAKRVEAYLEDGVRQIWIIDAHQMQVTVHAPDFENPVVLKGTDTLDGGDVLPDFKIPLPDLFA